MVQIDGPNGNRRGVDPSWAEVTSAPCTPGFGRDKEMAKRSDDEWKRILTPEQYRITRRKGTERAFTGEYWNTEEKGTYRCVCCGAALFRSEAKYDSGTGWPSFYAPVAREAVREIPDAGLFTPPLGFILRTEVICAACDAHLGHVFPDGPPPTGTRYCINSGALSLERDAQEAE